MKHITSICTLIIGITLGIAIGYSIRSKSTSTNNQDASSRSVVGSMPRSIRQEEEKSSSLRTRSESDYRNNQNWLNDSTQLRELSIRFRDLATTNPKHALELAARYKGKFQEEVLRGIAEGWMRTNPEACVNWIATDNKLVSNDSKYYLLGEASRYLANSGANIDLILSQSFSTGLKDSARREYYYSLAIRGDGINPSAISSIAETESRTAAIDGAIAGLSTRDDQKALEWALKSLTGVDSDYALKRAITESIANNGLAQTSEWLRDNMNSLTERQIDSVIAQIGLHTEYSNPQAAIEAFSMIIDSKTRDSLIRAQTGLNYKVNADYAFQVSTAITDRDTRLASMLLSINQIKRSDSVRAKTLIESCTALSQEDKILLLKKAKLGDTK